jgi:acyl-coenzyme A thioesterase PaaI-like protein
MSRRETASVDLLIRERLGRKQSNYLIPPPVFTTMQGRFLSFDSGNTELTAQFPVLGEHLNPYGAMQGGMVAAAIDNTLGPLSLLVAPPNVTRRLQVKYSRPVTPDLEYVTVTAKLVERRGRWLTFSADARDGQGTLLARAQAVHWIVEEVGSSS